MAEGAAICPTGAIKEQDGHYAIDQRLCIKCNACREVNPEAIRIVDFQAVAPAMVPEGVEAMTPAAG